MTKSLPSITHKMSLVANAVPERAKGCESRGVGTSKLRCGEEGLEGQVRQAAEDT